MLELREGDLDAFFRVPFDVYGPESLYVSPFRSDLARWLDAGANPLFRRFGARRFFTAHRDGRPVGRIVAHIHRASNERHGTRRSCFGFFDCADDPEAAGLLLGQAEAFGREEGADEIAGNFNLTAMQQMGVMTEGFENAPYTDQVYGPPHIPRLLAGHGYEPFFPMSTWEVDLTRLLLESREADPGLRWERLRRRTFAEQTRGVRQVLNEAFDRNPFFVPLTEEEFLFQTREMMWIVDERIACLVRDGERTVGTVICIPDLNPFLRATGSRLGPLTPWHFLRARLRRKRAVIIFYAVSPSHQNRGLNGAMLHRVISSLQAAGYERLGITWIADVNLPSLRQVERLGARRLHRLHLFRKALA
ncbi:MAG TPA: GNAT family N-acetyltransferase [Thermoanaerobaculia bacterium]|nr:GNAT family N-acetyltransferase [Thermoanaerobaculia bacterium]